MIKDIWRQWNPVRLRRLLDLKGTQIANTQNGWANTHMELLQWKALCNTHYTQIRLLDPDAMYQFVAGYEYLNAGGK